MLWEADGQDSRVQCHICSVCLQVPHRDGSLIPPPLHICLGHGTVGHGRGLKWVRPTQMEKKLPLGHCRMTNTHRKKRQNMWMCVHMCVKERCSQILTDFYPFHLKQIGSCVSRVSSKSKPWTLRKARGCQEFLTFGFTAFLSSQVLPLTLLHV